MGIFNQKKLTIIHEKEKKARFMAKDICCSFFVQVPNISFIVDMAQGGGCCPGSYPTVIVCRGTVHRKESI